jgi:cation diffusion facilitator CzcD-associated flavoprotein CzcO
VMIVGAGTGGLSLAHGLRAAKVDGCRAPESLTQQRPPLGAS